jgi:hypothetical protein
MTRLQKIAFAIACAVPLQGFAAETLTHITPGTEETAVQLLDAPAADDTHRLWNEGTLGQIDDTGYFPVAGIIITGAGEGRVEIDNEGILIGDIDLSGIQGGVTFDNRGQWLVGGYDAPMPRIKLSAGDDLIYNGEGASIEHRVDYSAPSYFDFGAGTDVFENAGTVQLNGGMGMYMSGLEVIRNSGSMMLGGVSGLQEIVNSGTLSFSMHAEFEPGGRIENAGTLTVNEVVVSGSRESYVDGNGLVSFENSGTIDMISGLPRFANRVVIDGADFIATGNSVLRVDAHFADAAQSECTLSIVGSADCLSIRGGSTSGVTLVHVQGTLGVKGAAFLKEGLVIVDVRDGETEAGHFVLDPNSPGYEADAPLGGGIRGDEMFTFHLLFDEATRTQRLLGVPDMKVQGLGVAPIIAQNLWRTAERTSVARQAELRSRQDGGGLWFKKAQADISHTSHIGFSLMDLGVETAVKYEQEDDVFALGIDTTGGDGTSRYSVGVSVGEVGSEFKVDGTHAEIEAMSFAAYGGYQRGAFFVNLSGGGYAGDLDGVLALSQNDYAIGATVDAVGGRVEGGYRLQVNEVFALEPLLSVVYTRTSVGAVQHLPGNKNNGLRFDSASSLLTGAGARAELDMALTSMRLSLSLAARAWEELEGETSLALRTIRDPFSYSGGIDGSFTEIDASVGLGTLGGAFSGYLSFGGRFGDEYDSTTASLGLRYNW